MNRRWGDDGDVIDKQRHSTVGADYGLPRRLPQTVHRMGDAVTVTMTVSVTM
ncbi:hypothetical protein [Streptomyces sanglieri]|uniref:hypothetical protein n=1 Tax=Streptomyces sanglieri TaxID=193460 RepID=UPI003524155B